MQQFGFLAKYMDYVEKVQSRKIVLFGAGATMPDLLRWVFTYDQVAEIWDNDPAKWGKRISGIPVSPPPGPSATAVDDVVVIITINNVLVISDIRNQLLGCGIHNVYPRNIFNLMNNVERYNGDFSRKFHELNTFKLIQDNTDKIRQVRELLADEKSRHVYDAIVMKTQYNILDYTDICDDVYDNYFSDGIFTYENGEVLVDGGAFLGEDTIHFARLIGDKFKHSYCFEPDAANYERCIASLAKRLGSDGAPITDGHYRSGKFSVLRSGLYHTNENIAFTSYGGHASMFSHLRKMDGGAKVPAVRLDDAIPSSERVTLIKLDIEGAEMSALKGAEQILKRDHPKLAICIYHNIEDLWTIPLHIHALAPGYKLFVRHHTNRFWDSVLYARV